MLLEKRNHIFLHSFNYTEEPVPQSSIILLVHSTLPETDISRNWHFLSENQHFPTATEDHLHVDFRKVNHQSNLKWIISTG